MVIVNNCYFKKGVNDKDPKFKVGDHVRISKQKIFLLKDTHQTGLKGYLLLVKLKIQFHGHILLMISMVKKLLEHFMKKNCKRLIKKNLGLKRWLKEKEINYMLNGKFIIVYLIAGLIGRV